MWTRSSDPFGTDAANTNPSAGGAFAYNLRLLGQLFDGQASLHQSDQFIIEPAVTSQSTWHRIQFTTDAGSYSLPVNARRQCASEPL